MEVDRGVDMDVLSDVVSSLRSGRPFANREDRAGAWRIPFAPFAGAGFHIVLSGSCRLLTDDAPPRVLDVGDVVLTPHGTRHTLEGPGHTAVDDANGSTSLLCGAYRLDRTRSHPLLTTLPEVIHLRAQFGRHPALRSAVSLLGDELRNPQQGSVSALSTLLDLLLVYMLRAWLDDESGRGAPGWSAALADPVVGAALSAMHRDPARAWTVEELGKEAAMSRAAFARRFTGLVGQPPLAYLTWWRLSVAARLLKSGDTSLDSVARSVGYGSRYAFANAFKRAHGIAPGRYRLRHGGDREPTRWDP
ncbi:AraC family transcriptional regulator [Streptomyces sp. B3I8]|uniref:AraC family transcriptional regulator n=1 Tax=Streptomyces sp. B3I8 TaxID=3042303 RepID=UPI0027814D8D|nr:AraC family transcriptional regulator [Streptomyces sp. B3I8]MDQ0790395.1 AraC-like DNA-binding protein [Streptomyces sp. B3I8]